ncbi:MAG: DUF1989 domain-containing protein [Streptosporangiaceae bacterium]
MAAVLQSATPLFRVTADTVGVHDLTYGSCSPEFYAFYLGDPQHPSGRAALAGALESYGIDDIDIPAPVNIFQNTPAGPDGRITYQTVAGPAGDYLELRALRDCLIAATACPCDIARGQHPERQRCRPDTHPAPAAHLTAGAISIRSAVQRPLLSGG